MESPEVNPDEVQTREEKFTQEDGDTNSADHLLQNKSFDDSVKLPADNKEILDKKDVDLFVEKEKTIDTLKKVGNGDKKVSFKLPSETDTDLEPVEEVKMRQKKPKKHKQGHRRESAGVVTYKKIGTSELMGF